jgi:diketogulonate reductase-like aldo/keto reductase
MFDTTTPANARHAEIADALTKVADQASITLPQPAHAFVRAHPAVTFVIIGPRTPQQLEDSIAASDVVLTDDVLDAIDAIVPPGTDVNPADGYHTTPPSFADPASAGAHSARTGALIATPPSPRWCGSARTV